MAGKALGLGRAAVLGAVIYAGLTGIPALQGNLLTKELLSNVCMAAAMAIWARRPGPWGLFALGCVAGTGFVIRQTFALFGALLLAMELWRARRAPAMIARRAFLYLAGCATPLLLETLAAGLAGRFHQHLDFYSWLLFYAKASSSQGYADRLRYMVDSAGPALPVLGVLVLAALAVLALGRRWGTLAVLAAWLSTALVNACLVGNFFWHYVLVVLPPLGLLAGVVPAVLWERLRGRLPLTAAALTLALLLLPTLPAAPLAAPFMDHIQGRMDRDAFRRQAGLGVWTGQMAGVTYIRDHIRPGEHYQALGTNLHYFNVLGFGALPRITRADELLGPLSCYLRSDVRTPLYDLAANQAAFLDMVDGGEAPEWVAVHVFPCVSEMKAGFPELFSLLDARYEFRFSSGSELVYRRTDTAAARPGGTLPASLLARTVRLETARIHGGALTLRGHVIADPSRAFQADYPLPPDLAGAPDTAPTDLTALDASGDLLPALEAVGLVVRCIRPFLMTSRSPDGRWRTEIVTGAPEDGERVFLSLGSRSFEGYGNLGRLWPVMAGTDPGSLRIGHEPSGQERLRLYLVGSDRASLYVADAIPPVVCANMPSLFYPARVAVADGVLRVAWKPLRDADGQGQETCLAPLGHGPETPSAPFAMADDLAQRYVMLTAGWRPAQGKAGLAPRHIRLPEGNGRPEHVLLFRNGDKDYVGPTPDGIHRLLPLATVNGTLGMGSEGLVPGDRYDLYVTYDSGRVLWQRLQ